MEGATKRKHVLRHPWSLLNHFCTAQGDFDASKKLGTYQATTVHTHGEVKKMYYTADVCQQSFVNGGQHCLHSAKNLKSYHMACDL